MAKPKRGAKRFVKLIAVAPALHQRLKILASLKEGETLESFVSAILWREAKKPISIPRANNEE